MCIAIQLLALLVYKMQTAPNVRTNAEYEYVVRRLKQIHSTHFDHQHRVYILQVEWEGTPQLEVIALPEMFIMAATTKLPQHVPLPAVTQPVMEMPRI